MGERERFDLDVATARAWSRFQARLADHLVELGEDVLVVEVEAVPDVGEEGAAPYVQFAGYGEGSMLRGEVSSNHYLVATSALDAQGVAAVEAIGFHPPTAEPGESAGAEGAANFFVDLEVAQADRLAVMAVRVLREVFGVAHPAFLDAEGLEIDPDLPEPPLEPVAEAEEPLAVTPESAEHLRELVDRALTPLFGESPVHDEDGDIPVPWGSSLVYVRVVEEAPVIELFGCVADGVTDRRRAAFEVNLLNRDSRLVRYSLVEDRVLARVHLPAWPFVPEHLRSVLTGMSAAIDGLDDDLVARVGGRRAMEAPGETPEDGADLWELVDRSDEDERDDAGLVAGGDDITGTPGATGGADGADSHDDEAGGLHIALLTLLQLDADAVGSVDPELAASICAFDPGLVVRLIEETERQEIAWGEARDRALAAGDTEEMVACAHERLAWERTGTLLRKALRLVVERAAGRAPAPRRPLPPRRRPPQADRVVEES